MREYGGYIEFEHYHGKEYHEGALALNSGRHCVEYLIKSRKIKKLYMPYFMCDSLNSVVARNGVEVTYYNIDQNFNPILKKTLENGEWLYLVNFYGQLPIERVVEIKEEYKNIIVDNVQAFFEKPLPDVDTVYTCRKFFGVADGAYLYTTAKLNEPLERDCSFDRMSFLFGRAEKNAGEFYPCYIKNNERFATESVKLMSATTANIMKSIDYTRVADIRTENFKILHNAFSDINILKLKVPTGAFMYPLYLKNGGEIRSKLNAEKIFIPTLWPAVYSVCTEGTLEFDMAKNILPLPIDQRYSKEDMEYIIKQVNKYI